MGEVVDADAGLHADTPQRSQLDDDLQSPNTDSTNERVDHNAWKLDPVVSVDLNIRCLLKNNDDIQRGKKHGSNVKDTGKNQSQSDLPSHNTSNDTEHPDTRNYLKKDATRWNYPNLPAEIPKSKSLNIDSGDCNVENDNEEGINIKSGAATTAFKALGVPEWLDEIACALNITVPTEIQRRCLPAALHLRNIIGCAPTGTGKTICFCWPILVELGKDPYGIFALVLTASRELALQIAEQFTLYGLPINATICTCVGGQDIVLQATELENRPNIVIGTPGRVSYQMTMPGRNVTPCFTKLKFLVFDEADRLLCTNFESELGTILSYLPTSADGRITHLFSASITNAIDALCNAMSSVKFHIVDVTKVSKNVFQGLQLQHKYLFLPERVHLAYLVYLFQTELLRSKRSKGIIFTGTRRRCQLITHTLDLLNFKATCVHSLMKQRRRNACMEKFKSGACQILVATDLISRGIDVPDVEFVVNYDVPNTGADYLHRVGRTARNKRSGVAISMVDENDVQRIENIESSLGISFEKYQVDDNAAVKWLNKVTTAMQKALIFLRGIDFCMRD